MSEIIVKLRLDMGPFQRGMHDAGQACLAFMHAAKGQPVPPRKPYPRSYSQQTARQYRAARRRYAREVRAYRRRCRS